MQNKGKLHISGHSKKWKIPTNCKEKKWGATDCQREAVVLYERLEGYKRQNPD